MKRVVWIGSSRTDLKGFPVPVRRDIGQALYIAQQGETDPAAKPLKGFGGASVMEIVERHDTNTYRAVYTTKFAGTLSKAVPPCGAAGSKITVFQKTHNLTMSIAS